MTEERRQKLLQSSQGPGAEPFSQYNHMKVTAVDDGTATVELELHPDSLNCWGTPHGGALFTLADMAFGLASNFGQEDGTMISTNATISYMKSAKTGPIVAEARLANGGRHLATYEVKIYDGQGTYIACAMISGPMPSPGNTQIFIESFSLFDRIRGTQAK